MKKLKIDSNDEELSNLFHWALEQLQDDLHALHMPLIGIGVGMAGLINPDTGSIMQSIPLGIEKPYPFVQKVRTCSNIPVFIENDANCCCWDEMIRSQRKRSQNFLFVLAEDRFHSRESTSPRIGFAVGMGVVIHGKVLRGDNYSAGEFKSILWNSKNVNQFSIDDERISNPEKYPDTIYAVIHELASHVAFLVNLLNLSLVVLGGGIQKYGNKVLDAINQEIKKNYSYPDQGSCEVCFVDDGEYAVALGAGGLFLEHLFSVDPLGEDVSGKGYEMFQSLIAQP
jgi:predicted NBD/HSP70 family sugar kinase